MVLFRVHQLSDDFRIIQADSLVAVGIVELGDAPLPIFETHPDFGFAPAFLGSDAGDHEDRLTAIGNALLGDQFKVLDVRFWRFHIKCQQRSAVIGLRDFQALHFHYGTAASEELIARIFVRRIEGRGQRFGQMLLDRGRVLGSQDLGDCCFLGRALAMRAQCRGQQHERYQLCVSSQATLE